MQLALFLFYQQNKNHFVKKNNYGFGLWFETYDYQINYLFWFKNILTSVTKENWTFLLHEIHEN